MERITISAEMRKRFEELGKRPVFKQLPDAEVMELMIELERKLNAREEKIPTNVEQAFLTICEYLDIPYLFEDV